MSRIELSRQEAFAPAQLRAGFTLLELLAVLLLTALVLGVALDFFMDISKATARAAEGSREMRRAVAILDRVGRDLEGTTLAVTPAGEDPLYNPWIFLAESQFAEQGSDHLKFITRGRRSNRSDAAESDLATVSYTVSRDDDDLLMLLRTMSPRLPEGGDREFPPDEEASLVADRIEVFSLRFQTEEGAWVDKWDSTTFLTSSELPRAVEIEVGLAIPDDVDLGVDELPTYKKVVLLPVPPLDLASLTDPASVAGQGQDEKEDGEEGKDDENDPGPKDRKSRFVSGRTVGDCVNIAALPATLNRQGLIAYYGQVQTQKIAEIKDGIFPDEAIVPACLK